MRFLHALLLWLDGFPERYWTCAWLALAALVASALLAFLRDPHLARWNRPLVFLILIGVTLFAFRWPFLFDNRQGLNPDESQMIAGAIALKTSTVFWRDVDGTTHGPLVQWPLALAGRAGMRLDYTNARIFTVLLMWTAIACTWRTLAAFFGDGLGRVLVLPLAALLGMTVFWDFAQYSSEHVPLTLIAAATCLLVRQLVPDVWLDRPWSLAFAGTLLGAVPFAKLQGVPIALFVGVCGVGVLLFARDHPRRDRLRACAWLIGGALVVPTVMLSLVTFQAVWPEFWSSYIETNLFYATGLGSVWRRSPDWIFESARHAEILLYFFAPAFGLLALGLALFWKFCSSVESRFAGFAVGGLLAAYYAATAPGNHFQHYLQFLLCPLTLAVGAVWGPTVAGILRSFAAPGRRTIAATVLAAAFLGVGIGFQIRGRIAHPVQEVGRYTATGGKLARRPLSVVLRAIAQPGDRLGLWGWMPVFFVETDLPPATREAHTYWQITPTPHRDAYRARYWQDFQRTNPPFFVDAVGPANFSLHDRAQSAHETFPTLAQHLAAHYRLVADHDSTRVYVRHDRLAAIKPEAIAPLLP